MSDERAKFEAWAKDWNLSRRESGEYYCLTVEHAWYAWQAAIAQVAAPADESAQDARPGSHHLTPESIAATIADLEAMSLGTATVPIADRDWVVACTVLAKQMRHLSRLAAMAKGD